MGIMGQLGILRAIAVLCLRLGDLGHEAEAISVRRHSKDNRTEGVDPAAMTTWSAGMPSWQGGAVPAFAGSAEQPDLAGPYYAGSYEGYGPQAQEPYYAGADSYPPSGAGAYPPGGAAPSVPYANDPYGVPGPSKKSAMEGQAGSQWPPFMPLPFMSNPLSTMLSLGIPLVPPPKWNPPKAVMRGLGALMLSAPFLGPALGGAGPLGGAGALGAEGPRFKDSLIPPVLHRGSSIASVASQMPLPPPLMPIEPPSIMPPIPESWPPPMGSLAGPAPGPTLLERLLDPVLPPGMPLPRLPKIPGVPSLSQILTRRGSPFLPERAATRKAKCGAATEQDLYRPVDEVLRLAGGVDGYCYFQLKAPWLVSTPHHDYRTHANLAEEEMQTSMNTCGGWLGDSKGRELTYILGRERVRTHMDCEYYAYDDLYGYAMGFLKGQGLPGRIMNNYEEWTKLAYKECQRIHDTYKFSHQELNMKAYMARIMPLKYKVDCTIKGGYDCQGVTRRDFKLHGYMKCLLGVNHFADDMAFGYQRACLLPDGQTIAHASECDQANEIQ